MQSLLSKPATPALPGAAAAAPFTRAARAARTGLSALSLGISLGLASLLGGCGGGGGTDATPAPQATLSAAATPLRHAQAASTPLAATVLPVGDIDKGTFCYAEPLALNADVSDLKSSFNANNWLATITGVYGRRWPSGKALAQAQANDQYFKGFVDTSSFNKLAESLMVAIHEETHMWDLAGSRTQWNSYTAAWIDDSYQVLQLPLYDSDGGFPRKEILALIKDDASSSMDDIYLKDAAQGDYHMQGITAEMNAGLMGLPAALAVAEYIDGIGASNSRDIALTNLSYLQLYLRTAKANHVGYFNKLKSDAAWRKFVLIEFLRTAYFIQQSEPHAAKLGSSKVAALKARVYAPENLAILEEFSGYKFPRQPGDACMGGASSGAPQISSQPASVTASIGQAVSFAVQASGTNLAYQWRKNGSAIPGAANATSYSIPAVQPGDAGAYSVQVSNAAGSVLSATATLVVNPAAVTISVTPASVSLQAGGTQTFSASVSGSSNTAVSWSVQEAGGGSVSSSGVYTAPATAGTYHVKATSQADSSKSALATITVTAAGGGGSGSWTGSLAGAGSSARFPSSAPGYYTSSASGTFTLKLSGPSTADYDIYLYKQSGSGWSVVAKSEGPTSTESISYRGTAGNYYVLLKSYSGSGSYTLSYVFPK
ncbi:immunoglobulin domain-containing protein [Paucibacter sp. APW11]|uniref:Immunoglobulin domain-containing protein n=1 Tax=Roseateles aquae TaxID=3077235 RepID=A0ABU3PIB7_9BURK|nr:immunoglobulin domain-containing protein [Paucibacter sp. APW11]MDT9002321.1 immunoglobulin domain-containing protein [Paucibacter sp. APW11]